MHPARELDPGFSQRAENFFGEQLVTQSAVEAFVEGVLGRFSGCDVMPVDVDAVLPLQNSAQELCSKVADCGGLERHMLIVVL